MTPEEKARRDAWLSEMWRPVREWRPSPVEAAAAADRNALLGPVESDVEKRVEGAA